MEGGVAEPEEGEEAGAGGGEEVQRLVHRPRQPAQALLGVGVGGAQPRLRGEGARGPARGRGEAVAAVAGLQGTQPGQQVSTLTAAAALVAPEHEQSLLHI